MNPSNWHCRFFLAPARDAIKFERVTFHGSLNATNPYKGPPSPELDAAWHDLLAYTAIRVSSSTLKKIDRTSVPLSDGSGYFATLGKFMKPSSSTI